jgi:hypothetical protein
MDSEEQRHYYTVCTATPNKRYCPYDSSDSSMVLGLHHLSVTVRRIEKRSITPMAKDTIYIGFFCRTSESPSINVTRDIEKGGHLRSTLLQQRSSVTSSVNKPLGVSCDQTRGFQGHILYEDELIDGMMYF